MRLSRLRNVQAIFLILFLAGSMAWQLPIAAEYLEARWLGCVTQIGSTDAIDRTAISSWGNDFNTYLRFLRAEIPEAATVVISPLYGGGYDVLVYKSLVQYFLFPRKVEFCRSYTRDDCPVLYDSSNVYVVYQAGIPSQEDMGSRQLLLFTENLGVYLP